MTPRIPENLSTSLVGRLRREFALGLDRSLVAIMGRRRRRTPTTTMMMPKTKTTNRTKTSSRRSSENPIPTNSRAHFVAHRWSRAESGQALDRVPPWMGSPPPQGSSLWPELCCLEPSSLSRPHPPHPRAHRDFHCKPTYTRCLRCAGAPRRPAGGSAFSLSIPSQHAVLYDLGELDHRFRPERRWPSPRSEQLGTSDPPAIASREARISGLPGSRICYGL
jgi:hypothetical protein